MLVIDRGWNESFVVHTPAGDVTVTVAGVHDGRVKLGINAPKDWPIHRDDIRNKNARLTDSRAP